MKEVKTSRAWLLDFGRGLKAAVGAHEMSQVIMSATLFEIPCTPFYCNQVLILQERILPVLDLPSLLEGQRIIHSSQNIIGIAAYQPDPTQRISYGGLHLATTPSRIFVRDDQLCRLPPQQKYWQPLAWSCFSHENTAIPIIDLNLVFSETLEVVKTNVEETKK